jgi:hypothetical protein
MIKLAVFVSAKKYFLGTNPSTQIQENRMAARRTSTVFSSGYSPEKDYRSLPFLALHAYYRGKNQQNRPRPRQSRDSNCEVLPFKKSQKSLAILQFAFMGTWSSCSRWPKTS